MRASKHMCAAAEAAFAKDDFSAVSLSSYQKAWEADIGKELKRGFKLRSMYNRLSDKDLNGVLRAIDRPFFREIALTADIDRPSDLYVRVMKHPLALMRLFPYLVKGVIG
jgi:flavin-dependent dehydrogenase